MESPFGIEHGEVSKGILRAPGARGISPIKGIKAHLSRKSAGGVKGGVRPLEDPFAIGDKPKLGKGPRGTDTPYPRPNTYGGGQSSLPRSANKDRPLGRIKRSY